MLSILRQKLVAKGLSANVYEMDMCALALQEKFDLIIIPFNSFAEILSMDEQRQALQRIGNCLTEKGRFICTLHNPCLYGNYSYAEFQRETSPFLIWVLSKG